MQENVSLINEINELRREIKGMKIAQRAKDLAGTASLGPRKPAGQPASMQDAMLELVVHKDEISRLRQRIDELEASGMGQRSTSRETLPMMEGVPK